MKERDLIKELLDKYRLAKPLPDREKKKVLKAKKRSLIAILRAKKKYSLIMALAVSFFFWIKRLGITISLGKSAIIALVVLILSFSGVTVGAYYTAKYFLINTETEQKKDDLPQGKKEVKDTDNLKPEKAPKPIISIASFQYDEEIGDIGRLVNRSISSEIFRIKGRARVALVNSAGQIGTEKVLTGSIIKIGDEYRITAKIIDRRTSRILYLATENAASAEDVNRACSVLASQIAVRI